MPAPVPFATVIVPTYQRPAALAQCLAALRALDYPQERLEIVVVNDGGVPPAIDPASDCPRLRVIHQANAGPATARNAGAEAANGSILAFTDDDCRPAPDWLRRLVDAVQDRPDRLAGGRTLNALANDPFATASQLLVDFLYEYHKDAPEAPRFFTSNNFALDAERFRALGGFDPAFRRAAGEDRDFCDRWIHTGGSLHYDPLALVHHAHAMSLRAFWRQHFAYGRGAWRFHLQRARRGGHPVRVEPLPFNARLVAYPLRRRLGGAAAVQLPLLLLSQVANAAGYFAARFAEREPASAR